MHATVPTLMSLWLAHRTECRPIGAIVSEARAGQLPGVRIVPTPRAELVEVTDETAVFAAMLKDWSPSFTKAASQGIDQC